MGERKLDSSEVYRERAVCLQVAVDVHGRRDRYPALGRIPVGWATRHHGRAVMAAILRDPETASRPARTGGTMKKVTLTHEQLLRASQGEAVEVVPAPGPGKRIVVVRIDPDGIVFDEVDAEPHAPEGEG